MINISAMKEENLSDAVALWICQFNRHCYCNVFLNFIDGGQGTVKSYIKEHSVLSYGINTYLFDGNADTNTSKTIPASRACLLTALAK